LNEKTVYIKKLHFFYSLEASIFKKIDLTTFKNSSFGLCLLPVVERSAGSSIRLLNWCFFNPCLYGALKCLC